MVREEDKNKDSIWSKGVTWIIVMVIYALFGIWFAYYLWELGTPSSLGHAIAGTYCLGWVLYACALVKVAWDKGW